MRNLTITIILFCAGCASNPYTAEYPSPFDSAALSWVGHDIREMAKAYGTPTEYMQGSDVVLDPGVVVWVDSNERDLPAYEKKPQEVAGYNTSCHSYGNTTNCDTVAVTDQYAGQESMERAGHQFGIALAQAGMYRCNVVAIVDPVTSIVLEVKTDQKSFRQCEKRHDIVNLTRRVDDTF